MSSAAVSLQPNHRKAEPGPSILRLARTNSPLRPRDAPEKGDDPLADLNARFEKLGRPRMSREDYYGPGVCTDSSDYAQPAGLSDDSVRHARLLNSQRDVAARRSDADERNKRPSVYQEEIVPLSGLTSAGPPPPSLTKGGPIAFAPMPPAVRPENVAHKKAVAFSSERTLSRSVPRPHQQSVPPLRRPQRNQPDFSRDVFTDAVAGLWLASNGCGPVLQPMMLPHIEACLELNPLLIPPSSSQQQHCVQWEIVFRPSYARCSHKVSDKTWSEYLRAPATSPRLRKIFVISKSFPWFINVSPGNVDIGVTCGDVLDAIYTYLYLSVREKDIRDLPSTDLEAFHAAYVRNRSRKDAHGEPAASLLHRSATMRRVDWLARKTFFGGLSRDNAYVAHRFGTDLPATFILHSQELPFEGS
ncbi:hypothetical protein PLICRDRAFT_53807 [Plicaturopsis crispa FD-325 SS-3]|nr:hypothetical protein PLICRDRAFT_53807 [Plicaturopsis crispa FD-325 SS-3]